jgi:hypothetical protein
MNVRDTIAYIDGMRYKPEWSFKAMPAGFDTVRVEVYIETVDSRKDHAPLGYPEHITLDRSFYINGVSAKTAKQLDEYVFVQIADVESHEMREFFRITHDGWNAPFHPHTPEGEDRYKTMVRGMR